MFSGQKDILVSLEERKCNKGKVKSLHCCLRGIRAAMTIIGMVLVSIVNEYNIFIYIVNLIKSVSCLQGDACKKTNVNGWMLGKCCLFGVSDLFLTFPGVFFNFKK